MNEGERLKQEGMQRAIENADSRIANWSISAYNLFLTYLKTVTQPFMAEDFRKFAESKGLETPLTKRAYGPIMVRAKKEKLIKSIGYSHTDNPIAHNNLAGLWVKYG